MYLITISTSYAVDGDKDLKFGDDIETVLASNLCTFEREETGQEGFIYYGCTDFSLAGEQVEAGVFFINSKFLRIAILPPIATGLALLNSLHDKYGPHDAAPTQAQLEALDTQPNAGVTFAFDGYTVLLNVETDENFEQTAY